MDTKKTLFDEQWEKNRGNFPMVSPPLGHEERFRKKLAPQSKPFILKYSGIAASVVLGLILFSLWYGNVVSYGDSENYKPKSLSFAENSTENIIDRSKAELISEAGKNNPQVQQSLNELKKLEQEYNKMEKDLVLSGNEKVIESMHKNLEMRIKILSKTKEILIKSQTP